jgi:hypothetical protein
VKETVPMVSAALVAQNNKAVSTPMDDAPILAAYWMIVPRCGCIRDAKQEQLHKASPQKEADPPKGRSFALECSSVCARAFLP